MPRTDSKSKEFDFKEELLTNLFTSEMIDQLVKSMTPALTSIITKSVAEVFDRKLADIAERVATLENKTDGLQKQIDKSNDTMVSVTNNISSLVQKIHQLESYTRRENLVITGYNFNKPLDRHFIVNRESATESNSLAAGDGVASRSFASAVKGPDIDNTYMNFSEFCYKYLRLDINLDNISALHMLSDRGASANSNTVWIVKFTSRAVRDRVYKARVQLKDLHPREKIFINEHLIPSQAALYKQARLQVKNKKIFKAWTFNGAIYVKKTSEPSCRPKVIMSADEFISM